MTEPFTKCVMNTQAVPDFSHLRNVKTVTRSLRSSDLSRSQRTAEIIVYRHTTSISIYVYLKYTELIFVWHQYWRNVTI